MKRITEIAKTRLGIDEDNLEPYGRYKAKLSLSLHRDPEGPARRQARAGHRHLADAGGRGQDDHHRGPRRCAQPARQEGHHLPARAGARPGVRREGRRCRRRLFAGRADGGHQPPLHRRLRGHRAGEQPARPASSTTTSTTATSSASTCAASSWKRVVDVNDRALRDITIGLGGPGNGYPRQDGFDIVVASEVMAIFCLATSVKDLKERLGKIVVGYTRDQKPILARDLKAHGAMTALLRDAMAPNLVQTLENNPAFIHGGPFANIAHGCNSVMATQTALKLADYVVTEARLRRRPRRREVRRHQVPQGGPQAVGCGHRRHGARAQVPRRRAGGGSRQGESRRAGEGPREPRAPHPQRARSLRPAAAWWRSTHAPKTRRRK